MPYTCVRYRRLRGCRGGGVTGVLSLSLRVGSRRARAVALRARRRPQGATAGRPGERGGGGQRAGAVGARARSGAALLALTPQRSRTCVRRRRAAQKAQKPRVLKFYRPILRFGRRFSLSLLEGFQNGRARLMTGRCCVLNSHCYITFVFRPPPKYNRKPSACLNDFCQRTGDSKIETKTTARSNAHTGKQPSRGSPGHRAA